MTTSTKIYIAIVIAVVAGMIWWKMKQAKEAKEATAKHAVVTKKVTTTPATEAGTEKQ